jgi:hypothetical protein
MKIIELKYEGKCRDCGAALEVGSKAKWYGRGRVYGIGCHENNGKAHTKPTKAVNPDVKVGDIFKTSWGYNMTHNDYIQVVSTTAKTAMCRMLGRIVKDDCGRGAGTSVATKDQFTSGEFRMCIRDKGDRVYLVGSYPFCNGSDSKRKDYFHRWDGKPNYYNTHEMIQDGYFTE